MITESTVESSPATTAMMRDTRVPQTSCEKMSCPYEVVPSRCAPDGPSPGLKTSALGLYGAIWPGKTARTTKTSRMMRPATAFLLESSDLPKARVRRASLSLAARRNLNGLCFD